MTARNRCARPSFAPIVERLAGTSWPRVPLYLTLGRTSVRYSLDATKVAIVVHHVVTPSERAG